MRHDVLLLAVAIASSCARGSDAPVPETPDAAALASRSAPGDLIAQCFQRIRGRLVALGGTCPQLSTIKEAKTTPTSLVYQKGRRKDIPAPPAAPGQAERKGGPYEYSEENACHIAFYFHYPVHPDPPTACSDLGHYYEEARLRLEFYQWHHGAKAQDADAAVLRIVREEADRLAAALRDLP